MLFYVFGSLLFGFALLASWLVMGIMVRRYAGAMSSALRTLSWDGWTGAPPVQPARAISRPTLTPALALRSIAA